MDDYLDDLDVKLRASRLIFKYVVSHQRSTPNVWVTQQLDFGLAGSSVIDRFILGISRPGMQDSSMIHSTVRRLCKIHPSQDYIWGRQVRIRTVAYVASYFR
jgi:hypothetical protein